jgi:monoamine oxidase
MRIVTAVSSSDAYRAPVDRSRRNNCHIRVLRWTFRRGADEAVVCELALTGEDREYELRAPAEWNPTGRPVERFDDALTAFQRHAMIERQLLDQGWELDSFESERITVH